MIEDRTLTRIVLLDCNDGSSKRVEQTARVQLRWMSDVPEVDPNPLGLCNVTPWRLVPLDERNKELERIAEFNFYTCNGSKHGCERERFGQCGYCDNLKQ